MNNPSQIDLPVRPSRAFWINLKLISVPEVGKTSSGAYQKYSGAGRIWQGNLSRCTTGNGLWAPGAARGRVGSLYTRKPQAQSHTDSMSLHVPNTPIHWHMLPNVQHSTERVYCAFTRAYIPSHSHKLSHMCDPGVSTHTYRLPHKIQSLSAHTASIYFNLDMWDLRPGALNDL